jgi:hypothetical protein
MCTRCIRFGIPVTVWQSPPNGWIRVAGSAQLYSFVAGKTFGFDAWKYYISFGHEVLPYHTEERIDTPKK